MGRVIKQNIVLENPAVFGDPVLLVAGSELPEWAEGMVGEHVFEATKGAPAPKSQNRALPREDKEEPAAPKAVEVPSVKAGAPTWRKFLAASGVKNVPKTATRDELIDMARQNNPDLVIEEAE